MMNYIPILRKASGVLKTLCYQGENIKEKINKGIKKV